MSKHPLNLAVRFILELLIIYALATWGWTRHTGPERWLWALGLPLLASVLWGVFRVPDDPGRAPVPVPGAVRLILEIALFGAAVCAFSASGMLTWAVIFGIVVLVHYLLSYDRITWMLKR